MRRSALVPVLFAAAPLAAILTAPTSAAPAAIGTLGVEFSASIPSDPQRDEGEPEISIDPAGNIYTCGPSGFSNIADYAQVSRDGGDQFHLLGLAPRGQISAGEGGGDCGLASAPVKNELDQYTWAYTGLGPLTNFSTGTARDTGKTLHAKTTSESIPGVDRQWMVFTDKNTVFLNYNQLAQGFTVQKSTDGGYAYEPVGTVASDTGGRIGPMRAILTGDPATAKVYFPFDDGTEVKLAMSLDGGDTWDTCLVGDAEVSPTAGFVVADHDQAGNIFVTYGEKGGGYDSYVMVVPAKKVAGCQDEAMVGDGRKILLNRGDVKTTVMPWIVASGLPGRFAVAYYGTDQAGNPNEGVFKAAWRVYISMTLDAFAPNVPVAQVAASSHPTHFDSICLDGLACTALGGDRSLVDYFALDLNPVDGRLNIVYNNAAKKPEEAAGHIGLPIVLTQMSGPSLLGGELTSKRPRTRATSSDPAGDALSPYGTLCATPPGTVCPAPPTENQPAMDFVDKDGPAVQVGPEIDLETGEPVEDGGFTVTLRLAGLSTTQLQTAAASGGGSSLIYLFRWNNGYQPAGATARWSPVTGWSFAYDGYETASTESGQADPTAEKIIVYPGNTEIPGDVNVDAGIIRLSVPRDVLKGLGAPFDEHRRPSEVPATPGTVLTSAVAYSLVNIPPVPQVQSYLYPVDNAPAMDFAVPGRSRPVSGPPGGTGGTGGSGGGDGSGPGEGGSGGSGGGRIPTTGGLGAPLVALALSVGALMLVRRRRRLAA
ncbi:MAG TPA: hypothetical protein VNA20_18755 [Frankiaceae bacterium]|nr:hypothetical protein [Frankiaceae bacterium]